MAMRFARLPAIAVLLFLLTAHLARAEGVGEISGRVISATAGTTLPTGLSITVDGYRQTDRLPTQTTPVNPDGTFRFPGIGSGGEFAYILQLESHGVRYSSEVLQVRNDEATIANFKIYAATTNDPGISFRTLTRFVKSRSSDVISVVEIAELVVPGDRAFIPTPRPGAPPPLRFGVPEHAFGLQTITNITPDEIVVGGPGFAVFRGFPPGVSTLVFGYHLALDNGSTSFRWSPTLDTETAILLIETGSLKTEINGLEPLGADIFGSTDVIRWQANKITTGTGFDIRVIDASENSIVRTLRGATTDRWAIAITIPALTFALGLVIWRRNWRQLAESDPMDKANGLLDELRSLQAAADTNTNAAQTVAKTELAELLFQHPTLLRRLRRTQQEQQGNSNTLK